MHVGHRHRFRDEAPPAGRSRRDPADRARGDDQERHRPSRHREGKAPEGRTLDDGKRESIDVKKGDSVLYAKYAGTEFKIDDEELLIVSQKDILAIVED